MKINNRLEKISEYHFKDMNEEKNKLISKGIEIVDFGIGDPDLEVNPKIVKALVAAMHVKGYNNYPPYDGIKKLKESIIKYYEEYYNVHLNEDEVAVLIGTKEGINNLFPAVCDINDIAILPEPAYPVYLSCCTLWGIKCYKLQTSMNSDYIPNLLNIPEEIGNKAKLFVVNYPNNPTGAVATEDFYEKLISYCKKHDIVLCNDGAYNEIVSPSHKPLSLLQMDKNKYSVEFGTLSKVYNMTGFRIGYIVGNSEIIKRLIKVKSNVDSGQFIPIQVAASEALSLGKSYIESVQEVYYRRKKAAEEILDKHHIEYFPGGGTFYVWCKVPKGYTAYEFCSELLIKYGVMVTPGYIFGSNSYDYFRISLTTKDENIDKGLERIGFY